MMDDSVVFAVRAKYADDLEELVRCPVCFERPIGSVFMCIQGHHLCQRCKNLLFECPICKSRFSETRNFVVEELCSKLPDILSSLLDPQVPNSVAIAAASIKKSICTQTDNPLQLSSLLDESVMIIEDHLTSSCRIGFCQAQLPPACMYHHVSDYHMANLVEVLSITQKDPWSKILHVNLSLKYDLNKLYDYAFYVEDLGLFFVNLYIDGQGNLLIDLHLANLYQNIELHYKISLYVPHEKTPMEHEGMLQQCCTGNKKFFDAHRCTKQKFKYYFEDDCVTLNERHTLPLKLSLYIQR